MSVHVRLDPPRPGVLLVIGAAPGDADVVLGGAVARWTGEGMVAHLVCCTSGEAHGDDVDADPLALAARYESEQRTAASLLGYSDTTFLHQPDGAVANDLALREQLVRIIRRIKPDAVAAPDPRLMAGPEGFQPADQRAVGAGALDAVHPAAHQARAFPDLARHEGLLPHRVARALLYDAHQATDAIDISATLPTKLRALGTYTGLAWSGEALKARIRDGAAAAGRSVDVAAAETVSSVQV